MKLVFFFLINGLSLCMRLWFKIIFLLLFFNSVFAQSIHKGKKLNDYIFRHIDYSDGLLGNYFHSITQDQNGFIWIATPSNLFQYDGHKFVNYSDNEIENGAEINFDVRSLNRGKENTLTIKNAGSIRKLNLYNNTFSDASVLEKKHSIEDTYTDDKGDNYYVQRETFTSNTSNKNNDCIHIYYGKKSKPYYFSNAIEDNVKKQIWINYFDQGLKLFDANTHKVYNKNFNPINDPLLNYFKNKGSIKNIMLDGHSNVWVLSLQGAVYKYNLITQKIAIYSIAEIFQTQNKNKSIIGGINCILVDDHGVLWLGGNNTGLLQYDANQDKFNYIEEQPSRAQSIHYRREIQCLFQDKNSNIWIGTDRGLNIFNPYRQNFLAIEHDETDTRTLNSAEVNAMIETRLGSILVGTWGGGITAFDSLLQFQQHFEANSIEEKLIWSFIEKDEKTIWAGGQYGLILEIDQKTLKTKKHFPPECEKSTIRSFVKDRLGNVFIGLHNGKVVQWNKKQNKFLPFRGFIAPSTHVSYMYIDAQDEIWVSTNEWIGKFDSETADFTEVYRQNKRNPLTISSLECNGIEQLNDSILLIGTKMGGLSLFNKRNKTFNQLFLDQNKQPYTVKAIKKDKVGNVWFTSEYAMYKYIPATGHFINIAKQSEVLDNSFSSLHFIETKNHGWFTWTGTKAIGFSPDKINENHNLKSTVFLSGIKVLDKTYTEDSILRSAFPLVLTHNQNFIQFFFTTNDFSDIANDQIFYKLDGVDNEWKKADGNGMVNYTDLRPSSYELLLKSEIGNSKSKITSFNFVIEPPFYLTWWFKLMVLCAVIGLAYRLIKHKIKKAKTKQNLDIEFAKKIASLEMQALRSQMNPHFIFNCINSIDSLIQGDDKYNATVYLNKFAKLIRNILDSSKQNTVLLSKDIETLKLYIELEELRSYNKFIVDFAFDEVLIKEDCHVPPLIVQPFVENAILHGLNYRKDNMGKLKISIKKLDESIHYIIEDNGGGRRNKISNLENGKISYGITMSTDRIRLFNEEENASVQIADVIENKTVMGTRVEVQLKIQ